MTLPLPILVGYAGNSKDFIGKPAFNAAALLASGKILFEQHKMLLPTYDVFDESRYFQPASSQSVYKFDGTPLGVTICERISGTTKLSGLSRFTSAIRSRN